MSAEVAPEKVVTFTYELRNDEGDVLDKTTPEEPMLYLHGASNIVPGLEKEMLGKSVGDKFEVDVPAADGYGEREDEGVTVSRDKFPADADIKAGMMIVAEGAEGEFPMWIAKVTDTEVTLDPNHPLAGVNLHFKVEISAIRDATKEELEHGHPHGPDGHADHH